MNALTKVVVLLSLAWCSSVPAQTSQALAEVRVRGDVRRILQMGDGSFVLGGFTAYFNGVPDGNLIRVTAGGARVPFPVTVNGSVQAMALNGPWLYLGGDFQVVNGVSLPFAARVNATTGAVDPLWRPAPNGDLLDVVPIGGGVVLSGSFSQLAGLPHSRLAMVSAGGTGLPLEGWRCDADNQVDRLLLNQGWLYAGGRFNTIGGYAFHHLARLAPGSGAVDGSWNPSPNDSVFDLAADATYLYCAGGFTGIGGAFIPFLARLPLNSASADSFWAPLPNDLITRVCVANDSVYVAGAFTYLSGFPQKYQARVLRATGQGDSTWTPPIDGALLEMVPDGGSGFWGGGRFDSGGAGSGFAHFLSTQGSNAPAYPATVENLGAVKVIQPNPAGGGWLVGGDFDTVNGVKRHALFRLGADGTADLSWNARLGGYYTEVNAMDVTGGNVLIGGQFEVPGAAAGDLLYNCLLLDIGSGAAVTTFKPQPSNPVDTILPISGGWLLGGEFNEIGSVALPFLARVSGGGEVDASFGLGLDGPVHCLLQLGNELYFGGEFTSVAGIPLPYLARLRDNTPDIAWQPRPNQAVFALAVDGNYLFAGGRFTSLARQRRKYLAQIPLGGAGTPTLWNPAPDNEVDSLLIDNANLYVGGAFFGIAGYAWPKLARFDLLSLSLDQGFFSTGENGSVYALEPEGDGYLLAGGSFNGWDNDLSKRSLVRIGPGVMLGSPPGPLPPGNDGPELLADYFAPTVSSPLQPRDDLSLTWNENPVLPAGMVSRVQWSTDLTTWRESGEQVEGVTRFVSINANGAQRTAQLTSDPPASAFSSLFLRIVITAGENTPSRLLP